MSLPTTKEALPLFLLASMLTGCGEDTGPAESASADPVPPRSEAVSQRTDTAGALTAEELAAEAMSEVLDDLTAGTARESSPDQDPVVAEKAGPEPDADSEAPTEVDWDALIPEEWSPGKIMEEYNADEIEDDDPRAQELLDKLEAVWREAPVVPELDGQRVRLPGFVVPLDTDAEKIGEFLLVPYYGACIHVPPPPANQTVHVVTAKGREYRGQLFDTVWITGTLRVESTSSDLAEAGYRMEATSVEPYE
jgi:hypothetical protein